MKVWKIILNLHFSGFWGSYSKIAKNFSMVNLKNVKYVLLLPFSIWDPYWASYIPIFDLASVFPTLNP